MRDDLIGQTVLGKLRVITRLGSGAHGDVYEVEHALTRHRRALKVIRAEKCQSGAAVARLVREASVASRVDHPAIAQTFDAGRLDDGRAFVVFELCRGETLAERVARDGPIAPKPALALLGALAEALDVIHARGVVHRDLKPANVMIGGDDARQVKLLDFGVAKILDDAPTQLTNTGAVLGTPLFMAPEQASTDVSVDAPADRYALGQLAFFALSGAAYFERQSRAGLLPLLAAVGRGVAASPSELARSRGVDLPAGFDGWFARACALSPSDRFAHAGEQIDALEATYRSPPLVAARGRKALVVVAVATLTAAGWALSGASQPTSAQADRAPTDRATGTAESPAERAPRAPIPVTSASAAAPESGPSAQASSSGEVHRPRTSRAQVAPSSHPSGPPDSLF